MAIKRLPLALVRAVSVEITMNGGNESSWYGNRELGIGKMYKDMYKSEVSLSSFRSPHGKKKNYGRILSVTVIRQKQKELL